MQKSPNFLTCPAVPELPPPSGVSAPPSEPSAHTPSEQKPEPPTPVPSPNPRSPKRKRFFIVSAIIAVFILLAAITIPPIISLSRAAWSFQQAQSHTDALQYHLERGAFLDAAQEADDIGRSLRDAESFLYGVGFWRNIPSIGTQVRGMEDAATAGAQLFEGISGILQTAGRLSDALTAGSVAEDLLSSDIPLSVRWKDLSSEDKRTVLRKLHDALPELRLAAEQIGIASVLWERIRQEDLYPSIQQKLAPVNDVLPRLQRLLEYAIPLVELLVPLSGYPDSQEYLLILQNADELRPSGGFVGSVVTASVDAGTLDAYRFFDVYALDHPVEAKWSEVPPEPIQKHLGVSKWFLRDANWSPDFPQSAERILDFYERERRLGSEEAFESPTGIIAVEPGFFRSLLRLTGPLTVREKALNERNFMDVLQYESEQAPGITIENRKDFVGEVGTALLEKLSALPRSQWDSVLALLTDAFDRKQVLIYSRDTHIQGLLDRRQWSGRAPLASDDLAWVIDANLAALKTDGVMEKITDYSIDLRNPSAPRATLTLRYRNTADQITWRYTRYRSYTRVYVPEGSRLVSSSGAMAGDLNQTGGAFVSGEVDVMRDLGRTVFGAFWSIEPGKTGELSFTYDLPPEAVAKASEGLYRLYLPKQPGADDRQLTVRVLLPRPVLSASPSEEERYWGDAVYEVQTDSLEDRVFEIRY